MYYIAGMTQTIPIRTLRNQVSKVIRDAEKGERIIVTVDGRPTAELGPVQGCQLIEIDRAIGIGMGPAARQALRDDLARQDHLDNSLADPWER